MGAVGASAFAIWARAQDGGRVDRAELVFKGPKFRGSAAERRAPETGELLVRLRPGAVAESLASRHGLGLLRRLASSSDWIVLRGNGGIVSALRRDPDVLQAGVNERTEYRRFGFTPNDPYFSPNSPSIGWSGQWHLRNQIGGTVDANLTAPWSLGWTGSGVVIGIVDDSLQKSHPDLAPNFSSSYSHDFGQNDSDPSPVTANDEHGTSVAGVAAARGGNGIGVTGAAPLAKLAGLRVDFGAQSTAMFVDATLYKSANGSESIKVKNHSYGYTVPFVATPLERSALATSAAQETIHVLAAGNERGRRAQDSNTLDIQSSPDAIAVAALGEDGKFASYSCFGSNVFVCAPSSSDGLPGIITTDVADGSGYNPSSDTFPDSSYTSVFGGTSSAAPLVTGVLALAKQANPGLNVRLAKHLLVRSSTVVDPADNTAASAGGWHTNGAGFAFNENYGFGCLDAGRLVDSALRYQGVTKLETESTGTVSVNAPIPDNSTAGIERTFSVASSTPLEDVLLSVSISHPYRGDLEIWLKSPMGTWSRLKSLALGATQNTSDSGHDINWTFSSNAFWGENPAGVWTAVVKDLADGDAGAWNSFNFTAHMGTPVLKDNAKFVSQSVPTEMIAGQTYTVGLQMQNAGYSTWARPAWYLRSELVSANTTWGFNQVNLASADSIAPGASKAFSFKIYAPTESGVYDFSWRMRHSGFTSFGDFSPDVPINVTLVADAARYVSATTLPSTVTAGSTITVGVTMRNVGTNPWTAGSTYGLRPTTSTTKWGVTAVPIAPGESIARGSDKTFLFKAVAPATPGKYVMEWRMHSGSAFFGDRSVSNTITVVAP